MKRILLFTVFLTSASVSWADEGSSCDDNINWTAVSAIANIILAIVALLALGWTWKEIKLMHSNSKADLYARYRSRFNINQDLRIVEKFIDIKKNRIIHNHEWPTPDDHQLVVFMQYYQEIGFLIEKGRIDKDILSGSIAKYLLEFDELSYIWKNIKYDSSEWDEFHKIVDRVKKNQNN